MSFLGVLSASLLLLAPVTDGLAADPGPDTGPGRR
jgi:hypothetical protein